MDPESAESSRNRILDAAEHLMSTQGYSATSVAQICKRSGLPNGSLYYHFGSKANVLAAIMERGAEGIIAGLDTADAQMTVEQYFLLGAEQILQHLAYYRIDLLLILEEVDDPAVVEITARVQERAEEVVRDFFCQRARASGVENPDDFSRRLTRLTFTLTRGSVVSPGFTEDGFRKSMHDHGATVQALIACTAHQGRRAEELP